MRKISFIFMAILVIVSSLGLTGSAFMQSTDDEIKDTNRFKITMKIGAWLDEDGYSIEAPRDEVDVTLSYVNNKYMEYIEKNTHSKKRMDGRRRYLFGKTIFIVSTHSGLQVKVLKIGRYRRMQRTKMAMKSR